MKRVHKGGVIRTLLLIAAASLVMSYVVMCIFWVASGCRYGARYCIDVFFKALLPCIIFICAAEVAKLVRTILRLKKLDRIYTEHGSCDEYFALLEKYLLKQNKDNGHGLLKLASMCIYDSHFDKCFETLDRIDFAKLSPTDQDKYFQLLLYGKLMSGDISQANEIFRSAKHYFERAAAEKDNSRVLFTLGLLEYLNKRFDAAEKYFSHAQKSRDADDALTFNCELYSGYCCLSKGDIDSAKTCAEGAAKLACDDIQNERLKRLMTQVEKAYLTQTKEKSANFAADQRSQPQRKEDMPFQA